MSERDERSRETGAGGPWSESGGEATDTGGGADAAAALTALSLPDWPAGRRSFWTVGLGLVEPGDLFEPDKHARLFELFPDDGETAHVLGARGAVLLLAAIPEEQLPLFEAPEWGLVLRPETESARDELVLGLVVGVDDPIECPFCFDLAAEQDKAELAQLTRQEEAEFWGVTHMEEGLMLTVCGAVALPSPLRLELRQLLLALPG